MRDYLEIHEPSIIVLFSKLRVNIYHADKTEQRTKQEFLMLCIFGESFLSYQHYLYGYTCAFCLLFCLFVCLFVWLIGFCLIGYLSVCHLLTSSWPFSPWSMKRHKVFTRTILLCLRRYGYSSELEVFKARMVQMAYHCDRMSSGHTWKTEAEMQSGK